MSHYVCSRMRNQWFPMYSVDGKLLYQTGTFFYEIGGIPVQHRIYKHYDPSALAMQVLSQRQSDSASID